MFNQAEQIFLVDNEISFNSLCLEIFNYQFLHNKVYKEYCNLVLKHHPTELKHYSQIPFLPIQFFKNKEIYCSIQIPEVQFTSSTTTSQTPSRHFVADKNTYIKSFIKTFELFYGPVNDYCILALLPSYLERKGSSLIFMIEELIKRSNDDDSGFFLYNHQELFNVLKRKEKSKKTLLFGVTFALLDFAEKFQVELSNTIIMETGGMKGRKIEQTREEVHQQLTNAFGTTNIHSEYGMTELLSQSYSMGEGIFVSPPWMRALIRDYADPFSYLEQGRTGAINIIDLANIYSCSFIATDDLGRLNHKGFEVLGRMDNSEIRGCNLMSL
jgi:hypothetical protein